MNSRPLTVPFVSVMFTSAAVSFSCVALKFEIRVELKTEVYSSSIVLDHIGISVGFSKLNGINELRKCADGQMADGVLRIGSVC